VCQAPNIVRRVFKIVPQQAFGLILEVEVGEEEEEVEVRPRESAIMESVVLIDQNVCVPWNKAVCEDIIAAVLR
jgi:hypothetical protein